MKPLMKQLTDNLTAKKQLFPLFIFGIIAMVVWYGGPLITLGDATPLAEPEKRFYTIVALFLAWVLKKNFYDDNTNQQTANTTPLAFTNPELAKKIQSIESRFQGAMRFLKKTMINKHGKNVSLYHLPWYLLIGPANSGKTSLLANANINFILAKQFKNENLKNIPPSDVCDWWVTRDSVMVDVPSSYLYAKQKVMSPANGNQKSPSSFALWQNFLILVKKYRGKKALTGVVLTLTASELMSATNKERTFVELKQQLAELREQFGNNLPFFLTITKCDQLSGFMDFFSDSGSDELSQAWGVTLPTLKDNESLAEMFTNRFNALIKRLNKQLIWRLHQERNPFTRPQIKDFPLQIERLKESVLGALKIIAPETGFNLQGVYLTSSMQQMAEEQTTHLQAASSMSPGALQILRAPSMPTRAYFTRQLLLQALLSTGEATATRMGFNFSSLNWRNHPAMYAASIGTAVLAAGFLGNEFRHSIKETYAIRDGLSQYQIDVQQASQQTPHLAKALPLMNALQQTAAGSTVLPYTDKAQQSAGAAYQQALKTIVLPQIRYDLENFLAATNNKNPEGLYIALKAYLMLGAGQHLQPDFVFNTLQQINPELFNKQNSAELSSHIHAALNTAWQPMDLDETLVARARKRLSNMMPLDLSYVIIKSIPAYRLKNTISLEINPDEHATLINKEISYQIPKMFTADAFQDIYDRQIPAVAREVTAGSWILGGAISPTSTENLTEQLRNLYVANYISTWENVLQNVQLLTPTTLAEVDAQLVSLAHDNSPLLQLLIAIKENTSFAPIAAASPKLAGISSFVASPSTQENSALYKTFVALNQAHANLQTVLNSNDMPNAAFKAASAHMKNPATSTDFITILFNTADSTPAPLRNWLTNIAGRSWHIILQNSAQYIEQHWASNVITTYNAQIANRYPFTAAANKEVSLDQFTKFLGTHGVITSFYQNYLQPFVESTPKGWSWKHQNNEQIPFSRTALNNFERAATIQHTFFPNEDNQLALKFTLQPLSMENDLKSFQLNVNSQNIQFEHGGVAIPQPLNWPGNKNARLTSLTFQAKNTPPANMNINGDWGWFRLVNKSTLKVISPKQLLVSFEVNGHKAKYFVFTQSHLNPFMLANLESFRLPQQLSDEA
jgi:type VI secretion system protein ImpL